VLLLGGIGDAVRFGGDFDADDQDGREYDGAA
jgi:hypothetical protein